MKTGLPQLAVLLACAAVATLSSARTYPSRAIRFVVPFPAGGDLDPIARDWGARRPSFAYDRAVEVANTPIVLTDVPYIDRAVWNRERFRQIARIDPASIRFTPAAPRGAAPSSRDSTACSPGCWPRS